MLFFVKYAILIMVSLNIGKRLASLHQGAASDALCPKWEGGGLMTFTDLFMFCNVIIDLLTLVIHMILLFHQLNKKK